MFRGIQGRTIPTTVRVSGVLRDFNMAMLKYVRLLRDLPAPVTEIYILCFAGLMTEDVVSMITLNTNLDFKYTRNTTPTKISTHGNFKIIASSK